MINEEKQEFNISTYYVDPRTSGDAALPFSLHNLLSVGSDGQTHSPPH